MHKENTFSSADFLIALRSVKSSEEDGISKKAIQAVIVAAAEDIPVEEAQSASPQDLSSRYMNVLDLLNVELRFMTEPETLKTDKSDTQILVPQLETQWWSYAHHDEHLRPELRRVLSETSDIVLKLGFGHTLARVHVSDNNQLTCTGIGLPDIYCDSSIAVVFPALDSKGKITMSLPYLLIEHTTLPISLADCLWHEMIHILLYYLWRINPSPHISLDGLILDFICEAFAQMQTVKTLGTEYLFNSVNLSRFGDEVLDRSSGLGIGNDTDNPAKLFLDTFPWVAASWVSDAKAPSFLTDTLPKIWADCLNELSNQLKPLFIELFAWPDLTNDIRERVTNLLGPNGPCGFLFQQWASILFRRSLIARFLQGTLLSQR